jgi:AcrR family transcriptional regulator
MPATEIPTDHRTRVAAEKRERMRRRLVESAMLVFAEKGVDASVIDDVLAAAEVSRGTFYHYFRTNTELLAATSQELGNELLTAIESRVGGVEDPAERIAQGLRLYLHTARRYPLMAKFMSRPGFNVDSPGNRFYDYFPRHIEQGIHGGQFRPIHLQAALALIGGTGLMALLRMSCSDVEADFPEQIAIVILRGLGVKENKIKALIEMQIDSLSISGDSLLERSHARHVQSEPPIA